jgi:hypothetical protein
MTKPPRKGRLLFSGDSARCFGHDLARLDPLVDFSIKPANGIQPKTPARRKITGTLIAPNGCVTEARSFLNVAKADEFHGVLPLFKKRHPT